MTTAVAGRLRAMIGWLHIIGRIARIGGSFYFIPLDLKLRSRVGRNATAVKPGQRQIRATLIAAKAIAR